ISRGVITFTGQDYTPGSEPRIMVYNISTNRLFEVPSAIGIQPDISVQANDGFTRVVWEQTAQNSNDIYAYSFYLVNRDDLWALLDLVKALPVGGHPLPSPSQHSL